MAHRDEIDRTQPPASGSGEMAEPSEIDEETLEPSPEVQELIQRMESEGWSGSPLVVHGDEVVGGLGRYEAARFLGMEDEVPTITLDEVFREAGMDMGQVASRAGGGDADRELFQDYLRELPRHVRDKYEI